MAPGSVRRQACVLLGHNLTRWRWDVTLGSWGAVPWLLGLSDICLCAMKPPCAGRSHIVQPMCLTSLHSVGATGHAPCGCFADAVFAAHGQSPVPLVISHDAHSAGRPMSWACMWRGA